MIPLKDNLSGKVFPWLTLVFIALNGLAFLGELLLPKSEIKNLYAHWAFTPEHFMSAISSHNPAAIGMALLTMVTAMFLHSGWAHFLGNMIFLQAFGPAVESRLGRINFVWFYLLGGFAAAALQLFFNPHSAAPMLGASGAIAAVLGAYLVFFPKAKFITMLPAVVPIPAAIYAIWILVQWIAIQLYTGINNMLNHSSNSGGIAIWAHIGGFMTGMFIAGVWYVCKRESDVQYKPEPSHQCPCRNTCHEPKDTLLPLPEANKPAAPQAPTHHRPHDDESRN